MYTQTRSHKDIVYKTAGLYAQLVLIPPVRRVSYYYTARVITSTGISL